MVNDPLMQKLVGHWQFTQSRISLAAKLRSPAEGLLFAPAPESSPALQAHLTPSCLPAAHAESESAMASYRNQAFSSFVSRPNVLEDAYVIQYMHQSVASKVAGNAGSSSAGSNIAHEGSASLSIRYLGKPLLEDSNEAAEKSRGFEYAQELPAFISRLSNQRAVQTAEAAVISVIVLGDEQQEVEAVVPLEASAAEETEKMQ
jgi:hypothetical protein